MTRVVAFAPDLMDRSRIAAAYPDAVFVSSSDELADADAELVFVDIARPGALTVVAGIGPRVVAFVRHDDQEMIDRARAAGCDEVLARSVFFRRLADGWS